MSPVEALLSVASHPDDAICAMSFNFWHRFSRHLDTGFSPQPINGDQDNGPQVWLPLCFRNRLAKTLIFVLLLALLEVKQPTLGMAPVTPPDALKRLPAKLGKP